MKVKDLLAALADVDPEAELVVQKDSEGNGYSPLAGIDHEAVYVPDSTWSGSVYSLGWTADEAGMTTRQWKAMKAKPRCVVLYPVN